MKGLMLVLLFLVSGFSMAEGDDVFLKHSYSWEKDSNGCMLDGVLHAVGSIEQMNRKEIAAFEEKGGYVNDGEAILMQCLYLVDPASNDHPKVSERVYKWVGMSYIW